MDDERTIVEVEDEPQDQEVVLALPVSVGQALINYLVTRPYNESAGLIHALQQLKPINGD